MNPFDFHFHEDTPQAVRDVLAEAYEAGTRIRIHCGNHKTGEVWLEERDVIGRVGRSTGPQKVPLLIATKRSSGGIHILDHCILRIQDVSGSDLYRDPMYRQPDLDIVAANGAWNVHRTIGTTREFVGTFPTEECARCWRNFHVGLRHRPF